MGKKCLFFLVLTGFIAVSGMSVYVQGLAEQQHQDHSTATVSQLKHTPQQKTQSTESREAEMEGTGTINLKVKF